MTDFLYSVATIIFFVLVALFMWGCDRLIGPDEEALSDIGPDPSRDSKLEAAREGRVR